MTFLVAENRSTVIDTAVAEFVATVEEPWSGDPLPRSVIGRYARLAVRSAVSKELGDGRILAELPGFDGVWADADTEDEAVRELCEVLLGWLELKIVDGDRDIPVVAGINLNVL